MMQTRWIGSPSSSEATQTIWRVADSLPARKNALIIAMKLVWTSYTLGHQIIKILTSRSR